jgi:hypothetical protein
LGPQLYSFVLRVARDGRGDRSAFDAARAVCMALVVSMLVASIEAFRLIPGWGRAWGLDLANVVAFHTCVGRDDPYLVTGSECRDLLGRAMPYPPLLYWAMAWVRVVPLDLARWVWAAFIVTVIVLVAVLWSGAGPLATRFGAIVFGALLATQFPAMFAIERGNNDAVVVLLWTLALVLFMHGRRALAGAAAGLAAAAKLYPAFACVVVLAGLTGEAVRGGPKRWAPAVRAATALVLAPCLVTVCLWTQTGDYQERVLPAFAAHLPAVSLHSHSVPATFGDAAPWVSAALVASWCAIAYLRFERAPVDVFAGGLAISTYVARTSFDYNLVTAYPLLVVLAARAGAVRACASSLPTLAVLALGVLSICGHRAWFAGHAAFHVALQIVWLVASAAIVGASPPDTNVRARDELSAGGTWA